MKKPQNRIWGLLTIKKKLHEVIVVGATVIFKTQERVWLLSGDDCNIYYVCDDSGREFLKTPFTEGQVVWVYVTKEFKRVISVIPFNGEQILEMPKLKAVEI